MDEPPRIGGCHDLTQQSAPYAHWDFVHPSSGDRLRIIPDRVVW